jgi:hypothetical protein
VIELGGDKIVGKLFEFVKSGRECFYHGVAGF